MNGLCVATLGACLLISLFAQTNSLRALHETAEIGKEIFDHLTSEEEERLIYHHDDSVIDSNLRDLPRGGMIAPELPLPSVPTMDPPLPDSTLQVSLRKSPKGFRSVMETAGRMLRLKRRPRTKLNPLPQYRSRPSPLISTQPDELEMAFKRIEIMASRVGLNMSSMPRRTQMKVIKKLTPKLPPRMSEVVKTALDSNDVKMFEYLPEPARDPLIEDNMEFINSFAHVDSDFGVSTTVKYEGVDISSISIAEDDHSTHKHFEDLTTGLVPPKYDSSSGYSSDFESYTHVDGSSGSHSLSPSVVEENNGAISEIIYLPSPSPLVSHVENFYETAESMKYSSSELKPQIFTRGNKALKISSVKNATPFPRIVTPAKDKVSHKPIRVSIISKDSINIPDPPVTEKQPEKKRNQSGEIVKAKVIEVKKEVAYVKGKASKEVTEAPPAPAPVETAAVSKEVEVEKPVETQELLTVEEEPKPVLVLDTYKNGEESPVPTADPFDLTSAEIAATVAELKKYEDYNSLEYSYLAPHPLEYPDHPDHPKSSSEELFNMEEYMAEAASEERPVTVAPSTSNPPLMVPIPMGGGSVILNPQFMGQHPHQQQHHQQQQQQNHPHGNKHMGMMRRPVKRPMRPMRRPYNKKPFMRPLRINNVEVKEMPKAINKECDYFSDDICLLVQDYPIEAISEAIDSSPLAKEMLVKEPEDYGTWVDGVPKHQEKNYNLKHYFGTDRFQNRDNSQSHRHRDFAGEGGFLCPSKVAYGKIKKAKSSTTGKWKFVVNYGDKTQTLRLEKCLSPGNTCSYVMPHYRTACTQVHNYHRLLAWDSEKGLHMDVFKAPVTCTCHVQGYYIPGQSANSGQGFTPAVTRRRDLPPKLNFSPPRTPMGRGGRKILPMRPFPNHLVIIPSAPPKPISPPAPPPAIPKAVPVKPQEDDIHELLQQYSSLREKIAKRKNERMVSYSVTVSNSTDSLRPKTRESRFTDKSSLKELKKLKSIIKNIKYNNTAVHKLKKIYNDLKKEIKLTTAPHLIKVTNPAQQNSTAPTAAKLVQKMPENQNKSAILNKNLKKSPKESFPPKMTRQRLIHHLKRNPKLIQMMKQQRRNKNPRMNSRNGRSRNFLKSLSDMLMGRDASRRSPKKDKRGRALDTNERSGTETLDRQSARQNTTQEILRRKALIAKAKQRLQAEKQRESKGGSANATTTGSTSNSSPKSGSSSSTGSSGKKGSGLTPEQRSRLRLSVNRPSKVNYSYHPIMDYYFGTGKNPDKTPLRTT